MLSTQPPLINIATLSLLWYSHVMKSAFQIIAFTDRLKPDGSTVTEIYAATTDTAEQARALAVKRLPAGWKVTITPGFMYAPAAVKGLPRDELHPMSRE